MNKIVFSLVLGSIFSLSAATINEVSDTVTNTVSDWLEKGEKTITTTYHNLQKRINSAMETTMHHPYKRLYRSSNNRILGGVCGGIAEYLSIDPTIVRLVFVGFTLIFIVHPVALAAYPIAYYLIPLEPDQQKT
jgi:phage shock protein C